MAPRRQRNRLPRRPVGEKHGWLRFDRYQAIHEGALHRHVFILDDRTTFERFLLEDGEAIKLAGTVVCNAGIVILVEKYLALRVHRGVEQARAYRYSYNAYIPGRGNVLRYDNAHLDAPDDYHRHEYDLATGEQLRLEILTREQFPTLIEVVDELEAIARRERLT